MVFFRDGLFFLIVGEGRGEGFDKFFLEIENFKKNSTKTTLNKRFIYFLIFKKLSGKKFWKLK